MIEDIIQQPIPSKFLDILNDEVQRQFNNEMNLTNKKKIILYCKLIKEELIVYDSLKLQFQKIKILNNEDLIRQLNSQNIIPIVSEQYFFEINYINEYTNPSIEIVIQSYLIDTNQEIPFEKNFDDEQPKYLQDQPNYQDIIFQLKKCHQRKMLTQNENNLNQQENIFLPKASFSKKRVLQYLSKAQKEQKKNYILMHDFYDDSLSKNSHSSLLKEHQAQPKNNFDFKQKQKPYKQINNSFFKIQKKTLDDQPSDQVVIGEIENSYQDFHYSQIQTSSSSVNQETNSIEREDEDNEFQSNSFDSNQMFKNLEQNNKKQRLKSMIPQQLKELNDIQKKKMQKKEIQKKQLQKNQIKQGIANPSQVDLKENGQEQIKLKRGRKKGYQDVDPQKIKKLNPYPKRQYFVVSDSENEEDHYTLILEKLTNQIISGNMPRKNKKHQEIIKKEEEEQIQSQYIQTIKRQEIN